jgi:hypothetical protein
MQTRLIQTLARQHLAELHRDAAAQRIANAPDCEHESTCGLAGATVFGRLRERLTNPSPRTQPAERELRAQAFPLWHAAKARLARGEASVEAVGGIVEAGLQAVEHAIDRVPDQTIDLA